MGKDYDIEAAKHYPSQMEDPQLRWGFIRKVYSILTLQLLLTAIIAGIVVMTPRINQFFRTRNGLIVYLIIAIFTIIREIILQASILTTVLAVSLTLFTFWAAKRGWDFNFLYPFLFCTLILILLFTMIEIFYPMGSMVRMVISFIVALLYCGFIIYDTDNLIKRCSYDEYIIAAAMLYVDMINLFVTLLQILGFIDG
ncbi:bax inhibitor 1-related protein [Artemisia annua]|uniref:Bax inhibitor 1-related protein n=1 Tax=Artemisia annua TaxID=35608 RepID=A0A2U1NXI0_ARTAN|nr:bax inhibitor 1-related protein [Artemisia annua]